MTFPCVMINIKYKYLDSNIALMENKQLENCYPK